MNNASLVALIQRAQREAPTDIPPDFALKVGGRIQEALGPVVRVSGLLAQIGELCRIEDRRARRTLLAEVIGLQRGDTLLTPLGSLEGISARAEVVALGTRHRLRVGPGMIGRVIDGYGEPIDGLGPIAGVDSRWVEVAGTPPHPMRRQPVVRIFPTGVRCIDALATVGEGQRLGIFAPAGTGKSTLMSMMARGADVDVIVLALVGERGREVREFIEHQLGAHALQRSVVVVATSDAPAMARIKCAHVATAVATSFRDEGRRVLLLMDSVTRFARAQREIGLASGEPPTRRGFPPSLFVALPQLLERAGQSERGSLTAFYTVLMESEDGNDPVAEEVRSILDGHLILSGRLAALGRYPAIDPLQSLSRLAHGLTDLAHREAAQRLRGLLAKYEEIETLVQMGEYQRGQDREGDVALDRIGAVRSFLTQPADSPEAMDSMRRQLLALAA